MTMKIIEEQQCQWYNSNMKALLSFIKLNWELAVIFVAFLGMIVLDLFNIPSAIGLNVASVKWLSDILTLSLGLLTLHFTLSIAKTQRRIEADKIASDKFFKINFIKGYQRLEKNTLKLKIREYDNNILRDIKVTEDVVISKINADFKLEELVTMKVEKECTEIEHTDAGLDKEWKENKDGFYYVRLPFTVLHGKTDFIKGETYRFDLAITATNIFGVKVKCKLHPWFKVYEIEKDRITFEATHNFGNYESVKYVG